MRKAVIQMFSGNLLSKLLGLGREILTGAVFGTGQAIGAFRVAQTGTLVPVNFFTSDSLNSAFVPQYKKFHAESVDAAQMLFWSLLVLFALLAVVLSAGIWILAPPWVAFLAPGLGAETAQMAVDMLRIMGLGVPFYLLSALLVFLGMANDDFVPMSARPIIQNIGLIAGVVVAFLLKNPLYLAVGFSGAYLLFSVWVVRRNWRSGLLALPTRWTRVQLRQVLLGFGRTLRPLLLLPLFLQGNIAVERAVASLISLAAVSSLDYARFVAETLIFLVSVPVAFAGLAHWSGLSHRELALRLEKVLLLVLLVAIPVSAFLAANTHVVVAAIYQRGAFDTASVQVTAEILLGISVGLWAQVLGYVLIKALSTQLRSVGVLQVMSLALLANTAFNLIFYPYLGAMTLGLGNSVYGAMLLVGAVTALGLWGQLLAKAWMFVLAVLGYWLLHMVLPQFGSIWYNLLFAVVVAALYWGGWIVMVPSFRQAVLGAVLPLIRRNL